MGPLSRLTVGSLSRTLPPRAPIFRRFSNAARDRSDANHDAEFRTINLNPARKERKKFEERRANAAHDLFPPREKRMHVDQNWTNVWPAAASFKASAVPLPVRMGNNNKLAPLDKTGNAELMKIPNFLHLTPAHIKKQCAAIKKFCTPWPKELSSHADCKRHFPVEVIVSDYCHSGQNIRNSKARIVSLKVPLASLNFDDRARDKFLRLVGDRYDPKTDIVTLITDRCPTRKQNYDYASYLITALYFESKKIEPWEHEKTVADFEKYRWEGSPSEAATTEIIKKMAQVGVSGEKIDSAHSEGKIPSPEEIKRFKVVQQYQNAVSELQNVGEDLHRLDKYKEAAKQLLGLSAS